VGGIEDLPVGLTEALVTCAAYPYDDSVRFELTAIQTHISHVFLSRDRVYKLRKAVAMPFLSFASRAERNNDCLREVALNRRLAPDVYLGVAPVLPPDAGEETWHLGPVSEELAAGRGGGSPFEHCVVMRRLASGCDALSLLARGDLSGEHVDAVARRVAAFHAKHGLGVPAPFTPEQWLERVEHPIRDTFRLARTADGPELGEQEMARIEKGMAERLRSSRASFEGRRASGRVVDGHGDLHLAHVWFETGPDQPLIIDCIEFNEELRRLDVAAELAFFAMDLGYRGRSDLAERFLRCYAAETDDFALYGVIDYHMVHRAMVRAAVAGVAAAEVEIPPSQRESAAASAAAHLAWAGGHLDRPGRRGLVIVCGMVGTGKSSVAEFVAERLAGVVIGSDRTRKHLAGIAADLHVGSGVDRGIYGEDWTRRVYEGLFERAEAVLASGRVAILDATFSRREWRQRAREFAAVRRLPVLLIETRCDEDVVLERLTLRQLDGRDVSDAGPAFYAESARRFEPPREWLGREHGIVRTDARDWRERLAAELERWL
jgi:aminoglycoside phosphotransferase family enzyme/predicted kinase